MVEDKDPPIQEMEYRYGPRVIDIGDVRVARGMSRRPHSSCKHLRLVYDRQERRIWCKDCERDIDGFDAFVVVAEQAHAYLAAVTDRERAVAEAEMFTLRSRAAKAIDEMWRGRSMVPCCPHCNAGLLPEFFADGVKSSMGADYARRAYAAKAKK